jgi:hypothetical protein
LGIGTATDGVNKNPELPANFPQINIPVVRKKINLCLINIFKIAGQLQIFK